MCILKKIMKLDDVCAVVTAVLLYINAEGGLLNGEKQMVTNKNSKEVQITAFSNCQLLPGLCVRKSSVS